MRSTTLWLPSALVASADRDAGDAHCMFPALRSCIASPRRCGRAEWPTLVAPPQGDRRSVELTLTSRFVALLTNARGHQSRDCGILAKPVRGTACNVCRVVPTKRCGSPPTSNGNLCAEGPYLSLTNTGSSRHSVARAHGRRVPRRQRDGPARGIELAHRFRHYDVSDVS